MLKAKLIPVLKIKMPIRLKWQMGKKIARTRNQVRMRNRRSTNPLRRFVTLSKQVPNTHGVHAQVAKLTLDDQGKLVKLVVSR